MKIKTVKAFSKALCIACLVFSISLVGCFSAAPSKDADTSTLEVLRPNPSPLKPPNPKRPQASMFSA